MPVIQSAAKDLSMTMRGFHGLFEEGRSEDVIEGMWKVLPRARRKPHARLEKAERAYARSLTPFGMTEKAS
jgi:hypothetical protein